ncbi:MAG: hypothetical protein HY695_27410 [Deltaproteobacteria bacterium]|nr:hypothetical protein [Deltaproteobacteria bacterium]
MLEHSEKEAFRGEAPASGENRPDQSAAEQQIENLVREIGRLVDNAEPRKREDLREFAQTLLREETSIAERQKAEETEQMRRPLNPLSAGLLFLLLGLGLLFIVSPVGLILILVGLLFVAWGGVMSWLKK